MGLGAVGGEEGGFEGGEGAGEEAGADVGGEADGEAEVVDGGEAVELGFLDRVAGFPEGAEGATGVAGLAGGAVAGVVEREIGMGELAEIDEAMAGVDATVTGFASGGDAIEGVATHFDTDENIFGARETEEVAGLGFGEFGVAPEEDVLKVGFEEGTAKTVAVEGEIAEILGGLAAEILPATALEDGIEMLAVAEGVAMDVVSAEAAVGPGVGADEGLLIIFVGVGEGGEFVECHVDIGADLTLGLHGDFGVDEVGLAGEGVGEMDASVGDLDEIVGIFEKAGAVGGVFGHGDDFAVTGAERHDLEATGVGDGGAVPAEMSG